MADMHEYLVDVKVIATARLTAESAAELRESILDMLDQHEMTLLDVRGDDAYIQFSVAADVSGGPDMDIVEIDGEAV